MPSNCGQDCITGCTGDPKTADVMVRSSSPVINLASDDTDAVDLIGRVDVQRSEAQATVDVISQKPNRAASHQVLPLSSLPP